MDINIQSETGTRIVSILCRTPGATIRYTNDGTEPSDQSLLYTDPFSASEGDVIRAKAWKEGLTPSNIATLAIGALTVTDPAQILYSGLSDGSVVFYDRGDDYGDYNLTDGVLTRLSAGIDDESSSSQNWRYLIAQNEDIGQFAWAQEDVSTGLRDEESGFGLPNTNLLIQRYSNNSDLVWYHVLNERNTTGLKWFVPSLFELSNLLKSRDSISADETWASSYYFSSTEYSDASAYSKSVGSSSNYTANKENSYNFRLIRRI